MHAALMLRVPGLSARDNPRHELLDRSVQIHRPFIACRRRTPGRFVRSSCVAQTVVTEEPVVADSRPSVSTDYVTSVGSPSSALSLSQWHLTTRHITLLNVVACAVAASSTWLFFSAIPAMLAFRKAAESLEKLMDTTREELPDTMASLRLSGMEIGDLTTELSDLGQQITRGVRTSTRAVRVAEKSLRQLSTMASPEDDNNQPGK
ncbi:hypothetical protein MLD38_012179 [Melastoma candidum]|uniref:Uncharacterized protein n=1 Tax=Melastoma candidum TaxID=119954 RepID=A0ACB9RDY0_9MYRT|nr:hypothetical protein MLD38_012179 [Melastoma candidum]